MIGRRRIIGCGAWRSGGEGKEPPAVKKGPAVEHEREGDAGRIPY